MQDHDAVFLKSARSPVHPLRALLLRLALAEVNMTVFSSKHSVLTLLLCISVARSARCYTEATECQTRSANSGKEYNLYCMNQDDDANAWEQCIVSGSANPSYLKFVQTAEEGACSQCNTQRRRLPEEEQPTTEEPDDTTPKPTSKPTHKPTHDPTYHPTLDPTYHPTYHPTLDPTLEPTYKPTPKPTLATTLPETTDGEDYETTEWWDPETTFGLES